MDIYKIKYVKYKLKYLNLKNIQEGGVSVPLDQKKKEISAMFWNAYDYNKHELETNNSSFMKIVRANKNWDKVQTSLEIYWQMYAILSDLTEDEIESLYNSILKICKQKIEETKSGCMNYLNDKSNDKLTKVVNSFKHTSAPATKIVKSSVAAPAPKKVKRPTAEEKAARDKRAAQASELQRQQRFDKGVDRGTRMNPLNQKQKDFFAAARDARTAERKAKAIANITDDDDNPSGTKYGI